MSSTLPPAAPAPAPAAPVETVRMYDTNRDRYVSIPKANQAAAEAKGYQPADRSALDAIQQGASQGATFGFGDELYGAAAAAPEAFKQGTALLTDPEARSAVARKYATARDSARRALLETHDQHPELYTGAEMGGALATGPLIPTAAGPIKSVLSGAAQGAAAGLGASDADTAAGLAKDTAVGAGIGGVIPGLLETGAAGLRTVGRAAAKYAPKALLEQVGLTPKTLGVGTRAEAESLAARAMKEPGLIPPLGKPATAESVAESAMASSADVGAQYGAILKDIDAKHGRPVIPLRDLGQQIAERTSDAVTNEPGWAQYVKKAIRALDPERFDAFHAKLVAAVAESPGRAADDALARVEAQPWLAYGPDAKVTLEQAHEAGQRIRGYGVAYPGPLDQVTKDTISKEVYGPAKSTIGGALRSEDPRLAPIMDKYGLHQTVEDAAKRANNWKNPGTPLAGAIKGGALAAAGGMLGGPAGAAAGAALPAASSALKPHVPRIAEAAGGLAKVAIPERVNRVSLGLSRVLAGSPPEKQAKVDFLLQERSPKYRAMRQADEKDPKARD